MKVIANDTIRVASAGGRKEQDEEFEVNDGEAKELIARGLVREAAPAKPAPKRKAKAAPKNKSAAPPKNKGA